MSKKKKSLKKDTNKKHLELNGKRIRFLSPDSSIYDTSSTIVPRSKPKLFIKSVAINYCFNSIYNES